MTHGGRTKKARRLQVEIAERLAVAFKLTIEASPPTKSGTRANGAVWVLESESPDLRVRTMGEAGADVALLTKRARACVGWGGVPIWWEACNSESWSLGPAFWRGHGPPVFPCKKLEQAMVACGKAGTYNPVVVLGKNSWEPMVFWSLTKCLRPLFPRLIPDSPLIVQGDFRWMPLEDFILMLKQVWDYYGRDVDVAE